ncbi:hypothetical protein ANANG_G00233470 [Anguilla anguilla]|uniref:Fibronectin type-III domain-containing protein n=1 Tax=Anguilla anguilla TaxID=7936 RepID=A0A9D3LW73_ANGAN|nr:hypothetical protein ANANG_G00233470 [Anguilla anguilla]
MEACVMDSERCDGFMDCSDHSDEDNCTADTLVYKIQNLHWSSDFSGAVTLTWSRPKNLPLSSCYFLVYYRLVGAQQWTLMETHSVKSSCTLTVLKPDTTYQVKVQTQCLNKLHKTNEVLTLRTPEGWTCSCHVTTGRMAQWFAPGTPDKAHGLIREYLVEYSQTGSAEWTSQRSITTTTEVHSLQPSALYRFRVAAVTGRGVGNWTEIKSITPQKALTPPSVDLDQVTENSVSLTFSFNSQYEVKQYMVVLSWAFDAHVKESRNYTVLGKILKVWAHTSVGDSPTALSHLQTSGSQPAPPFLKARPLNQTAVDCSWTGAPAEVYGVFFAPSFLDLYRSPRSQNSSGSSAIVTVDTDAQYLFLTYVVHVRDAVRKTERSYKLSTQNNTVEYCLKGLEPGGRYSISIRLRNMSKEASYTLNTVPLPAPDALKVLTENDHVFLFWKSLAVKEQSFNESRGYEIHMYDSVTNSSSFLGNTTDTFFRINSLLLGHNYTFSVQAQCLLNTQLCGEPALLHYTDLGTGPGRDAASRSDGSSDTAVVVVPVLFLLLLALCGGLLALYMRHRRLQNNFTAFANSHYNSRLGSAIFSSGDELGDDDEDAPMISGFSDDVPMVIA